MTRTTRQRASWPDDSARPVARGTGTIGPASPMRWRPAHLLPRRRRTRALAVLLPLLVVAWFAVPQLFVPTIRAKLQGMIAGHLDAKLQIGRLMYAPPF